MAYITQLPSGAWRCQVQKLGVRKSDTFDTKKQATAWGIQEDAAIAAGARGQFPQRSLAEALDRYVAEISPGKQGHRFEKLRIEAIKRDFPALCATVLHRVDTSDLAAWRDARLRGDPTRRIRPVSPGSVQRDINLLRNVFSIARDEWRWCGDPSPFRGLRMPGDNPARTRRVSPAEVKRLCRRLGYCTGQAPVTVGQHVAYAFLIGLRTGMRAGEILSLSPWNVDLEKRVAEVEHKMQYVTRSTRSVPLTRQGVRLLRPLVERAHAGKLATLLPISSTSLDAVFRKCRDSLGIVDLHFHDSRAEALTRLAKKVDPMRLARISGHKDLRVLMEVYYRESAEEIAAGLS